MALRIIEIITPKSKREDILALKSENTVLDAWEEEHSRTHFVFKFLVEMENTELLIDKISKIFKKNDKFRILVQDVEATIPLVETSVKKQGIGKLSVSREELYNQVVGMSQLNYIYLLMVAFATIIASFGFIENNWIVIIGSMVVAPLIAPNIAFSLGIALAHKNLIRMGILAIGAGVLLTLALSSIIGFIYPPKLTSKALLASMFFDYSTLIIALVSGAAGILAFTSGTEFVLIGVMISISLLPPLVAAGLLLSIGQYELFLNAMMLFFINFVALNLSGVIIFCFQGIRPKNWWEVKKAKKYRLIAISLWLLLLLLLLLITIIYIKNNYLLK